MEDRLRKEIKKELEYSNKKLEEMEKLVKILAQRKPSEMKIYNVVHHYDVDGGFGDAIPKSKVLYIFSNKAEAEKFVEKYNNPHCYRKPYSELWCGELVVEEKTIYDTADELADKVYDYDGKQLWWEM